MTKNQQLPAIATPRKSTAIAPAADFTPALPPLLLDAGPRVSERVIEFFTAEIENPNTRRAYGRAVGQFCAWMDEHGLALDNIRAKHVAAWMQSMKREVAVTSVLQRLAAVRMLFDYLVSGGVHDINPAASVRGPRHSVQRGKTPILDTKDAGRLLASIPQRSISGLRDRALIGLMIYTFARIGAALAMEVGDVFRERNQLWVRLHEKGGKHHVMPCHHELVDYLTEYLEAAGFWGEPHSPLFRTIDRRTRQLSDRTLTQPDAWEAVRRRAGAAGIEQDICNHTFRGTGITAYLEAGGSLDQARKMAGHADPRTTQLYDRRADSVTQADVERIRLK